MSKIFEGLVCANYARARVWVYCASGLGSKDGWQDVGYLKDHISVEEQFLCLGDLNDFDVNVEPEAWAQAFHHRLGFFAVKADFLVGVSNDG